MMRWWYSKPQSATAQYLYSAAIDYHVYSRPQPHLSLPLYVLFCLPPSYRPPSVVVVFVAPLIYTLSSPPLLARNAVHLDISHTHPPPVSAARSAPRAACLRLPSYPVSLSPLFPPLACTQVPVVS